MYVLTRCSLQKPSFILVLFASFDEVELCLWQGFGVACLVQDQHLSIPKSLDDAAAAYWDGATAVMACADTAVKVVSHAVAALQSALV